MSCHRLLRTSATLPLIAVALIFAPGCTAPGTVTYVQPSTHWAFVVSVIADFNKIAEALGVLWGARQIWLGRGERKAAEEAAAALARKAANYQAWQVVNSAQGKGGSGGRLDALQDLVRNGVTLAGVRLDDAWLEGIRLRGANLTLASLRSTILRGAGLRGANLQGADLTGADLRGAILKGAEMAGASLAAAELGGADLTDVRGWESLASVSYSQIEGVRHPPHGWREWMLARGAVEGAVMEDEAGQPQSFSQDWKAI